MTATVINFPRRLRLVDAVQAAVRRAGYEATANDGYSPKVLPIPPQKPRINCVKPVPVGVVQLRGHSRYERMAVMIGSFSMAFRSWNWRRKHRPEAVGFSRPQVATQGTKLARFVAVGHILPVNDTVSRAFPKRKAS